MRKLRLTGLLMLGLVPLLTGCNIIGPLGYLWGPRQIRETEFELTGGRLAVLIETARPEEDNPVFTRAMHKKLEQIFQDRKIAARIVPLEEIQRLRRDHADFARWSLQKVGRRLDAKWVLYARIDRLRFHESPGSLLLTPQVRMRLKLVDPHAHPDTARLWPPPEEREGRFVERSRPMREARDSVLLDAEAAKLGKDVAHLVAHPFRDVDEEEKVPWER